MDRLPPVHDPPNLIRTRPFSLERLLGHIDPGPAEESEEFVRRIYKQRDSVAIPSGTAVNPDRDPS